MPKFSVFKNNNTNLVTFHASDHNHLKALRYKIGSQLTVFDQNGLAYLVQIKQWQPVVQASIVKQLPNQAPKTYPITCYLGTISKPAWEKAVVFLNEIGLAKLVPMVCAYSQGHTHYDWKRITKLLVASNKQCERLDPLVVSAPISFATALTNLDQYDATFFGDLQATNHGLQKLLAIDKQKTKPIQLAYLVGPEGGFSQTEWAALRKQAIGLKLTNTVLRTETAALCLASNLISYFYHEL